MSFRFVFACCWVILGSMRIAICALLGMIMATTVFGEQCGNTKKERKKLTLVVDSRFQRRDRRIQEHSVHRVGCRWSGQDPSPLETLLPEHSGYHFRCGQQRPGPYCRGSGRVAAHAE